MTGLIGKMDGKGGAAIGLIGREKRLRNLGGLHRSSYLVCHCVAGAVSRERCLEAPALCIGVDRVGLGAGISVTKIPQIRCGIGGSIRKSNHIPVDGEGKPGGGAGQHGDQVSLGYRMVALGVRYGERSAVGTGTGHQRVFFGRGGRVPSREGPAPGAYVFRQFRPVNCTCKGSQPEVGDAVNPATGGVCMMTAVG